MKFCRFRNIFFYILFTSFSVFFSIMLLTANAVAADESVRLPDILSQQKTGKEPHLPDFSYAGYKNGLEAIPVAAGVIVNVRDFGAIPNDGKDDSKAVLAAIAKANSITGSVVVRFEAGIYRLTEVLRIERSNLILQGLGAGARTGGTTLFFPRPLDQVDKSTSLNELREYLVKENKFQREPHNNINELFTEYSWSGGFIWVEKPGALRRTNGQYRRFAW